jgi:iron-sulfur cluster repair protein YtfE (RIC family)
MKEVAMTQVTEPLRAEHRGLLPELESLVSIAESLDDWEQAVTPGRLTKVVAFLRDHLVPHAKAEEAVLYPAVERAMGSPRATATMVADHGEIVRRIAALSVTTAAVGVGPPSARERNELRAELFGLWAILRLHFDKEEEVLLPELDARLTRDEAQTLFADMSAVAHPA